MRKNFRSQRIFWDTFFFHGTPATPSKKSFFPYTRHKITSKLRTYQLPTELYSENLSWLEAYIQSCPLIVFQVSEEFYYWHKENILQHFWDWDPTRALGPGRAQVGPKNAAGGYWWDPCPKLNPDRAHSEKKKKNRDVLFMLKHFWNKSQNN